MSIQRNTSQQNAISFEQIERISSEYEAGARRVRWLRSLLDSHGLDPRAGVLVELRETPEQEGQHFRGTWLTASRRFWKFTVLVSREYEAVLEVEEFDDVTEGTVVSAHIAGAGKSFGHLALEALRRRDKV